MRKCKTVSFDLEDKHEAKLLEFAEKQRRFSKYMKRLIANDMTKSIDKVTKSVDPVTKNEGLITDDTEKVTGDIDSFF